MAKEKKQREIISGRASWASRVSLDARRTFHFHPRVFVFITRGALFSKKSGFLSSSQLYLHLRCKSSGSQNADQQTDRFLMGCAFLLLDGRLVVAAGWVIARAPPKDYSTLTAHNQGGVYYYFQHFYAKSRWMIDCTWGAALRHSHFALLTHYSKTRKKIHHRTW